jgi:hypothetical protein
VNLLLVGLASVVFAAFAPRAADVGAWIITLGFILPFFTFGGASFAWGVALLTGHELPFTVCLSFFGLPLGLGLTAYILKD